MIIQVIKVTRVHSIVFVFPYIFAVYASPLLTVLRFDLKFKQAETSKRNSDDLKKTFWSRTSLKLLGET